MAKAKARQELNRSRKVRHLRSQSLSRQRPTPSCLHGKGESQTRTQQIKKSCQHKNNMQSCLHGKDESKTEYSASRTTLTTWTTHPKNKQRHTSREGINKESSFKKEYNYSVIKIKSTEVDYIQASSSGEEITTLRLSTTLLAKSSTSGSIRSTASMYS